MKVPLQHHDERSLVGSTMRREIFKSLFPAGTNFPHLDRGEFRGRAFARIADGILARAIEQEEAPDDLFRLSEGAVNEAALAIAHRDTDTFGCRAERVVSFQNAACLQGLAERDHTVVEHFSVRNRPRLTLPDRLHHQQHMWHCHSLQTYCCDATSTIHPTPNLSVTIPNFGEKTVFIGAITTGPTCH